MNNERLRRKLLDLRDQRFTVFDAIKTVAIQCMGFPTDESHLGVTILHWSLIDGVTLRIERRPYDQIARVSVSATGGLKLQTPPLAGWRSLNATVECAEVIEAYASAAKALEGRQC